MDVSLGALFCGRPLTTERKSDMHRILWCLVAVVLGCTPSAHPGDLRPAVASNVRLVTRLAVWSAIPVAFASTINSVEHPAPIRVAYAGTAVCVLPDNAPSLRVNDRVECNWIAPH